AGWEPRGWFYHRSTIGVDPRGEEAFAEVVGRAGTRLLERVRVHPQRHRHVGVPELLAYPLRRALMPDGRATRLGALTRDCRARERGTVSASIRRRWERVRERPARAAPHRRSDGAPAPVL